MLAYLLTCALLVSGCYLLGRALRREPLRAGAPAAVVRLLPTVEPPVLELSGVAKSYRDRSGGVVPVFANLRGSFREGEFVAVMGASGRGKSTLLNLLGGLDAPDSGAVLFRGVPVPYSRPDALARYRARNVALVFQSLNLVAHLSASENAALPLLCRGVSWDEAAARARPVLERMGLSDADRLPAELSRGQQQRVAIARALLSDADVILADEPTGSLDPARAESVLSRFQALVADTGRTVVMVTHDVALAERYCDRVVEFGRTGPCAGRESGPVSEHPADAHPESPWTRFGTRLVQGPTCRPSSASSPSSS